MCHASIASRLHLRFWAKTSIVIAVSIFVLMFIASIFVTFSVAKFYAYQLQQMPREKAIASVMSAVQQYNPELVNMTKDEIDELANQYLDTMSADITEYDYTVLGIADNSVYRVLSSRLAGLAYCLPLVLWALVAKAR